MDYLDRLGNLALGSRLKRLSERLGQEVSQVYAYSAVEFEPKWFPVFRLLAEQQTVSVTDVAAMVGITHPAVNQVAQELTNGGLITSSADKHDGRKRLLSLSAKGKRVAGQLLPVWQSLHRSISDLVEESDLDLLNAIASMERALDRRSLLSRYEDLSPTPSGEKPEVIEFAPDLSRHFSRLNRVWIEKYFCLEDADIKLFANPGKIVEKGGSIFFIRVGRKIVGTCALIKIDAETYELAKMAVDEAYQGMGIGQILLKSCLDRAVQRKAKTVTLETNRRLKAAVKMYLKFGFEPVETHGSPYKRVDLTMKLDLSSHRSDKSRPTQKQKSLAKQ